MLTFGIGHREGKAPNSDLHERVEPWPHRISARPAAI
jgi:hypothetical protein